MVPARSVDQKAEIINGLYKAEVIWRQRSWPNASAVEMATLKWVDWFNNHRLFGPIGHIPPAEAEAKYYAVIDNLFYGPDSAACPLRHVTTSRNRSLSARS